MKFIILLLSITNILLSQNLSLKYNYQYSIDSIQSQTNSEIYILSISNESQIFIGENTYIRDSLMSTFKNEKILPTEGMRVSGNSFPKNNQLKFTYRDKSNDSFYFLKDYFYKVKIKYKDTIHLKWELKEDTLNYNGYLCHKATTNYGGRNYIAWYTLDIPIGAGPYVFNGLPGLILKISSDENDHSFELISLKNEAIHYETDSYIDVEKKIFYNTISKIEEDPIKAMNPEVKLVDDTRYKQALKMRKNKYKNPIERTDE